MTPNYKVKKGLSRLLEDLSNENLVYTFKDEIMQMHREGKRPSSYFNHTICTKFRAFDVIAKSEEATRHNKTIVTKKGLRLVRRYARLGNVRKQQVFIE